MEIRPFAARFAPLLAGCAVILILDQYTKFLIQQNFELGETMVVINGFFNLTYWTNKGSAFGFMSGVEGPWVGRVFLFISFIALIVVIVIYREVEKDEPLLKSALILIFGGASGNMADRFRVGSVTDFLDFYLGEYHWPAFNVADSCITIGVLLILFEWVSSNYRMKKAKSPDDSR